MPWCDLNILPFRIDANRKKDSREFPRSYAAGKVIKSLERHQNTPIGPQSDHSRWTTHCASLRKFLKRSLFRAKINSDYNDFVARVALEVVDGSLWKHQLRVKSAGSRTTALLSNEGASGQPLFAFA